MTLKAAIRVQLSNLISCQFDQACKSPVGDYWFRLSRFCHGTQLIARQTTCFRGACAGNLRRSELQAVVLVHSYIS